MDESANLSLNQMRTSEEVKKEQDNAIFQYGFHKAKVELHTKLAEVELKKIMALGDEADQIVLKKKEEEK
jgi:hypothetical protein